MKYSYILVQVLLLALATPILCNPYGAVYCEFDTDTGQLKTSMFIYRNNTAVTRAYFMKGGNTVTFDEIDTSGCQWTGNGSLLNPFTATVYINYTTGEPIEGRDDCNVTVQKEREVFYWHVHSQEEQPYIHGDDVIFRFICDFNVRLIDSVSTNGTVEVYDIDTDLISTGGKLSLEAVRADNNNRRVTTAAIGDEIQLKLEFLPSQNPNNDRNPDLEPWAAYCQRLYAQPADESLIYDILNTTTLCPMDHLFLRPTTGFIGSLPDVNARLFTAFLGVLAVSRFDNVKTPRTVKFSCEARLCWRRNDTDCLDPCSARSVVAGRRKRELVRLLTYELTVEDNRADPASPGYSESSSGIPSFIWIVIGAAAGILLIIMVTVVVYTMRRVRPEKYQHQRDSPPSSRTQSYHERSRPIRY